ncbi:MAG: hypothetical protein HC822_02695 [Oscillochloris sp.]|nr:hypothetical protein [Oscillochloris sp.]
MIWIVLSLIVFSQFIPALRRRSRALSRYILAAGSRVICLVLVALAASAAALNSRGVPPVSLPGTLIMSLVFWISGALVLRWLEKRKT